MNRRPLTSGLRHLPCESPQRVLEPLRRPIIFEGNSGPSTRPSGRGVAYSAPWEAQRRHVPAGGGGGKTTHPSQCGGRGASAQPATHLPPRLVRLLQTLRALEGESRMEYWGQGPGEAERMPARRCEGHGDRGERPGRATETTERGETADRGTQGSTVAWSEAEAEDGHVNTEREFHTQSEIEESHQNASSRENWGSPTAGDNSCSLPSEGQKTEKSTAQENGQADQEQSNASHVTFVAEASSDRSAKPPPSLPQAPSCPAVSPSSLASAVPPEGSALLSSASCCLSSSAFHGVPSRSWGALSSSPQGGLVASETSLSSASRPSVRTAPVLLAASSFSSLSVASGRAVSAHPVGPYAPSSPASSASFLDASRADAEGSESTGACSGSAGASGSMRRRSASSSPRIADVSDARATSRGSALRLRGADLPMERTPSSLTLRSPSSCLPASSPKAPSSASAPPSLVSLSPASLVTSQGPAGTRGSAERLGDEDACVAEQQLRWRASPGSCCLASARGLASESRPRSRVQSPLASPGERQQGVEPPAAADGEDAQGQRREKKDLTGLASPPPPASLKRLPFSVPLSAGAPSTTCIPPCGGWSSALSGASSSLAFHSSALHVCGASSASTAWQPFSLVPSEASLGSLRSAAVDTGGAANAAPPSRRRRVLPRRAPAESASHGKCKGGLSQRGARQTGRSPGSLAGWAEGAAREASANAHADEGAGLLGRAIWVPFLSGEESARRSAVKKNEANSVDGTQARRRLVTRSRESPLEPSCAVPPPESRLCREQTAAPLISARRRCLASAVEFGRAARQPAGSANPQWASNRVQLTLPERKMLRRLKRPEAAPAQSASGLLARSPISALETYLESLGCEREVDIDDMSQRSSLSLELPSRVKSRLSPRLSRESCLSLLPDASLAPAASPPSYPSGLPAPSASRSSSAPASFSFSFSPSRSSASHLSSVSLAWFLSAASCRRCEPAKGVSVGARESFPSCHLDGLPVCLSGASAAALSGLVEGRLNSDQSSLPACFRARLSSRREKATETLRGAQADSRGPKAGEGVWKERATGGGETETAFSSCSTDENAELDVNSHPGKEGGADSCSDLRLMQITQDWQRSVQALHTLQPELRALQMMDAGRRQRSLALQTDERVTKEKRAKHANQGGRRLSLEGAHRGCVESDSQAKMSAEGKRVGREEGRAAGTEQKVAEAKAGAAGVRGNGKEGAERGRRGEAARDRRSGGEEGVWIAKGMRKEKQIMREDKQTRRRTGHLIGMALLIGNLLKQYQRAAFARLREADNARPRAPHGDLAKLQGTRRVIGRQERGERPGGPTGRGVRDEEEEEEEEREKLCRRQAVSAETRSRNDALCADVVARRGAVLTVTRREVRGREEGAPRVPPGQTRARQREAEGGRSAWSVCPRSREASLQMPAEAEARSSSIESGGRVCDRDHEGARGRRRSSCAFPQATPPVAERSGERGVTAGFFSSHSRAAFGGEELPARLTFVIRRAPDAGQGENGGAAGEEKTGEGRRAEGERTRRAALIAELGRRQETLVERQKRMMLCVKEMETEIEVRRKREKSLTKDLERHKHAEDALASALREANVAADGQARETEAARREVAKLTEALQTAESLLQATQRKRKEEGHAGLLRVAEATRKAAEAEEAKEALTRETEEAKRRRKQAFAFIAELRAKERDLKRCALVFRAWRTASGGLQKLRALAEGTVQRQRRAVIRDVFIAAVEVFRCVLTEPEKGERRLRPAGAKEGVLGVATEVDPAPPCCADLSTAGSSPPGGSWTSAPTPARPGGSRFSRIHALQAPEQVHPSSSPASLSSPSPSTAPSTSSPSPLPSSSCASCASCSSRFSPSAVRPRSQQTLLFVFVLCALLGSVRCRLLFLSFRRMHALESHLWAERKREGNQSGGGGLHQAGRGEMGQGEGGRIEEERGMQELCEELQEEMGRRHLERFQRAGGVEASRGARGEVSVKAARAGGGDDTRNEDYQQHKRETRGRSAAFAEGTGQEGRNASQARQPRQAGEDESAKRSRGGVETASRSLAATRAGHPAPTYRSEILAIRRSCETSPTLPNAECARALEVESQTPPLPHGLAGQLHVATAGAPQAAELRHVASIRGLSGAPSAGPRPAAPQRFRGKVFSLAGLSGSQKQRKGEADALPPPVADSGGDGEGEARHWGVHLETGSRCTTCEDSAGDCRLAEDQERGSFKHLEGGEREETGDGGRRIASERDIKGG
ncbi:hypothetical protein BESB_074810 [Besnoitia besnoiti]|uniref:Uncharacterized protein n=1 Tax=Besnoitia besnoiti TaxID=94643 RepID=A0A2A9M8V1_BESBE|nr:uncharacterized protein BESB_074810 [Besnoitia besnoiti]PFH34329.1 hypothetical protein BESB_074810 [Besnoitia besnoiti]